MSSMQTLLLLLNYRKLRLIALRPRRTVLSSEAAVDGPEISGSRHFLLQTIQIWLHCPTASPVEVEMWDQRGSWMYASPVISDQRL
ncbi:hypothetical protein SCP_0200960 [Sparassis crispa]|uniref:Uncharacterized protein n=1 Tax=Sparassis crispa TaxID=139825 RepID=A0A401G9T0_9APHY|nr:hypothetical protein SCP_0200960 [Sparassis crispa]GBE78899.1 hypothetical protein SCP_0200960 [Sparassis crispa]